MFRVRPYSQIDPRWKDKKLGAGIGEQETIGYIGCLMTCVTMVATGFGRDETPASFNDRMMGVGGFAGKVRDVRGSEGYVSAQYVSTAARQDSAVQVLLAGAQPKVLAPAAGDSNKLVVRSTAEGLALRRQPFVSKATLIKREPLNAELLVLEHLPGAEEMIGKYNCWFKVRDIKGAEGYVAAWYVAKSPQPVMTD